MVSIKVRGLTGNGLKWIALVLMVLDHIHYFFGFTGYIPEWFSMAGRLAAPLFLFCLAEGFSHTRNKRKYFLKVYLIHLLMSGILLLTLCGVIPPRPDGFCPLNGMMTAFVILMAVYQGIDWLRERRWLPGLAAAVLPLAWPLLAGTLMGMVPALQMPLFVLGLYPSAHVEQQPRRRHFGHSERHPPVHVPAKPKSPGGCFCGRDTGLFLPLPPAGVLSLPGVPLDHDVYHSL